MSTEHAPGPVHGPSGAIPAAPLPAPPREQRLAAASQEGAGVAERLGALAEEPLEARAQGLADLAEDLRSALRLAEG
ncbi:MULTISPECIES: hypothetical protein [Actinomyces]|uniref:hypothetical protein n=1 Tax=Actinomyces TaxID=1654 RepID=UPI00135B69EE|nr:MULTISPECIES: hypothetical protein [Actinomyces]